MNEVVVNKEKGVSKIVEFKKNLRRLIDNNELVLPSNVSQEAFKNAAIVAMQDNPKILDCNPESVFRAIRKLGGISQPVKKYASAPHPQFYQRQGGRK